MTPTDETATKTGKTDPSAKRDILYVILWSLVIYATIPYMQPFMQFLGRNLGGDPVLNPLFAVLVFGLLGVFSWKTVRRPGFGAARGVWLAAILGVYAYFMWRMEIPAEKIHFPEYGILAILMFRAGRHWFPNRPTYAAVVAAGYLIGLSDEYIQSLSPPRVGEIADTLWNLLAVGLALLGIHRAWVPDETGVALRRRHVQVAGGLWIAALIACALFIHTISELGYKIEDPDIGLFRSAFTKSDLARVDAERGAEGAALIDTTDDTSYGKFLRTYTSKKDPYIHEARVHLFRRDRYLRKSQDTGTADEQERLGHLHVAVMENRILERYFPALMAGSRRCGWRERAREREGLLASRQALTPDYESAGGKRMITAFDRRKLWLVTAVLCMAILVIATGAAKRCER
ncbi:MAG: hypothetical protein A3G34_02050 [Candidatus Lindowbacteria bacterium RIFCSPLOWO2_12_FULL_62_27]|nr:MAG: hypothetical protein A3I06_11570 [Candidatus Lindowbacteria bacterium RIFCSPLOWO2_02_FULL_62_12]OGH59089.1 MAG: hypothetical protein A3G34_02050 [Candidatus Lindowbacteria bacterium RIFCSPLOWO2_12_FULL_62_27]